MAAMTAAQRNDLYCIGPAGGKRKLWIYHSISPLTDVDDSGYFNLAKNELQVGDVIICIVWTTTVYTGTMTASATANGAFKVVLTNDGTTVTTHTANTAIATA